MSNFDIEEHEHDSVAWDKHRVRMGRKIPAKIHGQSLDAWARKLATDDTNRIYTAISTGLTAGEDNTDIAHRVVGSRRLNGANGATEITRQHLIRLGRAHLLNRKSRMSGSAKE